MRSSVPSDQYASPRPESCRGAAAPRAPSSSRYIHSSSPVAASSATTIRRDPAVEYSTPLAISGVDSKRNSGRGPRKSVLKRQAISRSEKFSAVIWSSAE